MSAFSYNSNHKVVVAAIVILTSATLFYLRDHEKPSYRNGQSKQTGGQVDGRNHGLWVWYFRNGKKKMQGTFIHGEREGVWVTFSENGDTLTKATYAQDLLNGEHLTYSEGKIILRKNYRNDRPID